MKRLIATSGVAALILAMPSPAFAVVSPEPTTGTSFNQTVSTVTFNDGTFYVGGEFTKATTDGDQHGRNYLAAVSADGKLQSFAPKLDGPVLDTTADDEYLYVSGTFSEVDGKPHKRVARFSLDSGKLDDDFKVTIDAKPRALEVSGSRLYIGGNFNTVQGEPRAKLAAVDTGTGKLDADFAPRFNRGVQALEAADGRLYVGGGFTEINDDGHRKLAALDPTSGAVDSSFKPKEHGPVFDIKASKGSIYVAQGGAGGNVTAYADTDGDTQWVRTADGDAVALAIYDDTIYVGGHFESVCKNSKVDPDNGDCLDGVFADRRKLFALSTHNKLLDWDPDADSAVGVSGLAAGDNAIAAVGSFLTLNQGDIESRGFALFGG